MVVLAASASLAMVRMAGMLFLHRLRRQRFTAQLAGREQAAQGQQHEQQAQDEAMHGRHFNRPAAAGARGVGAARLVVLTEPADPRSCAW